MHRHAPRVLSTRTRVSNRRTPARTFPLANCAVRRPFSSLSLCLFFVVRRSVSVAGLVLRRFSLCSPSNTLETPIPVVGFAYRHCCSYHTPYDPSLHPRLHPREADCESTSRLPSGTERLRRPARPIVSIEGHLAHPRINYYA